MRYVRDLARKEHSTELAQLASRMASVIHLSSAAGEDPFAKVKGLITDMISRLEKASSADASHKAYCDKELSETEFKNDEKTADITKLATKIDQMSSRSAQLKEDVALIQKGLAEQASSQADMEKGLEGVTLALRILREYYAKDDKAHAAGEGEGTTIIGLLEVVESDFSKGLAEMISTEASAAAAYEKQSKGNEIEKTAKEQDVTYKT